MSIPAAMLFGKFCALGEEEESAVIERTRGKKLQVDFGKDQTALIDTWQVVED